MFSEGLQQVTALEDGVRVQEYAEAHITIYILLIGFVQQTLRAACSLAPSDPEASENLQRTILMRNLCEWPRQAD